MGTYNLRGIINGHLYPRLEVPNGREREKKQKAFTVVNLPSISSLQSLLSNPSITWQVKQVQSHYFIDIPHALTFWDQSSRKIFLWVRSKFFLSLPFFLGVQISQITEKLIWGKEVRRQGTCILKGKKGQVFSLQLGPFTDLCRLILSQKLTCFFVHLVSSQKSKA